MSEECNSCDFYLKDCDDKDIGYCRRFPPQFKINNKSCDNHEDHSFLSPMVYGDDWCGEWK